MSSNKPRGAIALDIGGTKIAAGIVLWPSGEILKRTVVPTRPSRGGEPVLRDTLSLASDLQKWALSQAIHIAGIGAGVAELVDCDGNVTSSCTIAWREVPVQQELSRIAPARVESDVRVAALAEAFFGAGQQQSDFIYITVGTGISYCLVKDGRPYKGARGNAIALASSALSTTCTHCGARLRPVLEEFASGPAIAKRFAQQQEKISADGPAGTGEGAHEVFRAASEGDLVAIEILTSAGEALGVSAAFLVNVLDPGLIVVGGGVGLAGGVYWDAFERACRQHIFAESTRTLPIIPAKLGVDAGLVGAGAIVFTQSTRSQANIVHETESKHS
jgi:glucokinase